MLRLMTVMFAAALVVAACGDDDVAGPPEGTGDVELGAEVFVGANPPCASCHTLSAAGADAEVGANLDRSFAPASFIEQTVRSGLGVMPSYEGTLSDDEIEAVASYVYANSAAANEP